MWLTQKRERVFFVAHRKEYKLPKLKLLFNEKPILFKEIHDHSWKVDRAIDPKEKMLTKYAKYGDLWLDNACMRYEWKGNFFTSARIYDSKVPWTIVANDKNIVWWENRRMNNIELKLAWSRPLDYEFLDVQPVYMIWMSVPPLMMYNVAKEIQKQRLDLINK